MSIKYRLLLAHHQYMRNLEKEATGKEALICYQF